MGGIFKAVGNLVGGLFGAPEPPPPPPVPVVAPVVPMPVPNDKAKRGAAEVAMAKGRAAKGVTGRDESILTGGTEDTLA